MAPRRTVTVPAARDTPAAEIRAAVAEALAEERERELAEARAFWAAQEARDAAGTRRHPCSAGPAGLRGRRTGARSSCRARPTSPVSNRLQIGLDAGCGPETLTPPWPEPAGRGRDRAEWRRPECAEPESAELAAARRRHPSHPDFVPVQTPRGRPRAYGDPARRSSPTTGTALSDVRPGPLGTLDVYVFADGTTLCMTPGHRETAERLAGRAARGQTPVLLGGSASPAPTR